MNKYSYISFAFVLALIFSCASTKVEHKKALSKGQQLSFMEEEVKVDSILTSVQDLERKDNNHPTLAKNGRKIWNQKCGSCHDLYPAESRTREEWKQILTARKKIDTEMNDADFSAISAYLFYMAKK